MSAPIRLALYIAGGIVLGLIVMFALWTFDPFGRRERAELRADTAEVAETIATETSKTIERTFHTETIIREEADAAVIEIAAQPGAKDLVPVDVLDRHFRGITSLRNDSAAGGDPRTVDPVRTMPTPVY